LRAKDHGGFFFALRTQNEYVYLFVYPHAPWKQRCGMKQSYVQNNSEWLGKKIKLSEVVSHAQNSCCLIVGRTRELFNESSDRSKFKKDRIIYRFQYC
jgi:hypothetical protein